ncbi:radical SAM protein [Proteiniclasticum sp. QWL-01]|uniref:radical SAM protein n=1 Tax=Proteiniclasticum sp. QWL-01 TaxID=3036945 RepID=UPI002410C8DA|nr:radical SAM protein [Proteiniclasticum sp. QWL-01]WFF73791.1 radical SAM protein [Proteiniclasticum sp. QWL-01]
MKEMKYIYGPVPSRRLGISPIPKKTCNYSCIYCQLGRTDRMTNQRQMFFPLEEILEEFREVLLQKPEFDVVTIVGEGEPTLYLGLGELIRQIRQLTDNPIAVITNGALLYDRAVQEDLNQADLVLPTLDAWDEASFRRINRPHGSLSYQQVLDGLIEYSHSCQGQLWLELMLMKGINDDDASLAKYKELLKSIRYDRLYLNTPVRPPAEPWVMALDPDSMRRAVETLGGISIDLLSSAGFHSEITDDYEAIRSIILRHPMNQFELEGFLKSRGAEDSAALLRRLQSDPAVTVIRYKGYDTYRLK